MKKPQNSIDWLVIGPIMVLVGFLGIGAILVGQVSPTPLQQAGDAQTAAAEFEWQSGSGGWDADRMGEADLTGQKGSRKGTSTGNDKDQQEDKQTAKGNEAQGTKSLGTHKPHNSFLQTLVNQPEEGVRSTSVEGLTVRQSPKPSKPISVTQPDATPSAPTNNSGFSSWTSGGNNKSGGGLQGGGGSSSGTVSSVGTTGGSAALTGVSKQMGSGSGSTGGGSYDESYQDLIEKGKEKARKASGGEAKQPETPLSKLFQCTLGGTCQSNSNGSVTPSQ